MIVLEAAGTVPAAPGSKEHIRQEEGEILVQESAASSVGVLHHQNNYKDQQQQQQRQQNEVPEISSRTSLTGSFTDSWMTASERSSTEGGSGVDVPPLLQSLFGLDFLPFSTIPEEDEEADRDLGEVQEGSALQKEQSNGGVPQSVEITSEDDGQSSSLRRDTLSVDDHGEVCAVHRHCPTRVPTAEREELQEMLLHHGKTTKKRPGKRMKKAVKGVFSKLGNRVRRHSTTGSLASSSYQNHSSSKKSLSVDTRTAAQHLPSLSPLTTTTTTETSLSPRMMMNHNNNNNNQNSFSRQPVGGEEPSSSSTTRLSETQQSLLLQQQVQMQEASVQKTQQEIEQLQYNLAASIEKYQTQLQQLQQTQQQLKHQVEQAQQQMNHMHQSCPANLDYGTEMAKKKNDDEEEPNNNEAKNPRILKRSESASFMRVSDLDLAKMAIPEEEQQADSASMSSLSHSAHSKLRPTTIQQQQQQAATVDARTPEFLLMDHYLLEIVQQLLRKGYKLITDEGERFTPTRDCEKFLAQDKQQQQQQTIDPTWPIQPWAAACDQQVLVWTGHVPHEGFGSTWPVVKGRAILYASAKTVLEYLWDSEQVPKYNPLSQGRKDIYTLQDNVDTCADHSPYGLTGCAKIVQSLNKHRLLPKAMEMKSLLYARPLQEHEGSYILVSRSVWETQLGTPDHDTQPKNVIRSEMLLGCTLLRALNNDMCEMTQLTHAYSPGLPEMMVRRAAPGQCSSLIQALQAQFPPPSSKK